MVAHEPAEVVGIAILARQPSGAVLARVTEVPDGSPIAVGAKVLLAAIDPCGECEVCRRGGAAVCPRMQPRAIDADWNARVSTRFMVTLGDGLELPEPAAAAVGGEVAIAYTLYARTGIAPRDPVVVIGDTAVTRFLVEILRAKGATPVVVTTNADLAESATKRGAIVVADSAGVVAATESLGLGARPLRIIATAPSELAATLAGSRSTLTLLAPALPVPAE
ncbi:MAG TPA: alcohol dehydrogenase catalytic domain-containing protein, partial [Kofleriaceae bacterium]